MDDMDLHKLNSACLRITAALKDLREDQREKVMGMVAEWMCRHCWRELAPGETCHCTSDE